MSDAAIPSRQFRVRARRLDAHHAHTVEAPSFEAAAIACVEDLHEAPGGEISIIVRDLESGREQCFRVDLEHEEIEPCA